jgi:hypothetical protein
VGTSEGRGGRDDSVYLSKCCINIKFVNCFLEIGLWRLFLTTGGKAENIPRIDSRPKNPLVGTQDLFCEVAKRHLPILMGQKYADVVLNCLNCVDEVIDDAADGYGPDVNHRISTGVRYIEKVCE